MDFPSLTLIIIFYSFCFYVWNKKINWRLNANISKTIKYSHFITLIICLIIAFLYYNYNIGLRGLWTTRIFIIFTLFTGIFFSFITNKTIINKLEKIYFYSFSFLPIATYILLCVPFLGVLIVFSLFGQLTSPAHKIYFEDKDIRIQSSFIGVLAAPRMDVYEKKGIFEKRLYSVNFVEPNYDSLKVNYDNDSTRIIFYYSKTHHETINIEKVK